MNDARLEKELFSRLFVIATQNKMNLSAFTDLLSSSGFVRRIEDGGYTDYFNKPLEDIFFDITGNQIGIDNSFGVYDDAYWCGSSYYELYRRTGKPLSYIFLKLPLTEMLDLYPVYHEMDISSLEEFFEKKEKSKTILRLLCVKDRTSLKKISEKTGIGLPTLSKYNSSDSALYKGSFQNIVRIANYFRAPTNLFVEHIDC